MQKILEKNLEGLTVILASNAGGDLFIGSNSDYENGYMTRFKEGSGIWCEVDMEFLHLNCTEEGVYCNVGIDLPVENNEFPYLLFALEELPLGYGV